MPIAKAGPRRARTVKLEFPLDRLAAARGKGILRLGPRPAAMPAGEVVVVIAREDEVLAFSFPDPSPAPRVPLGEAEQRVLGADRDKPVRSDLVRETARAYGELLAGSLSVNRAARLLGATPGRIRQRLAGPRRTLYGVKMSGEWFLPAFQFDARRTVPGIDEVIAVLDPECHPLGVERWFRLPETDLEADGQGAPMSPLDWLRSGRPTRPVIELAKWL